MSRLGKFALGVTVILAVGVTTWAVTVSVPVTHYRHTCVICRLLRVRSQYTLVPVTRYHETDCSRWYAARVEPQHGHVWERSVCTYVTDLYGRPRRLGCSPGRYPIWTLDPTTQLGVYQHFGNPLEAKALFADLTEAKTHDDRLDEHDESKGHLIVRALKEWEAAGFPGTWEDWWGRWWQRHVAERHEYLEWLNADSGLNFWDWQKQKAGAAKE